MNVLVLGATSGVGESLSLEFSPGNDVWLCGRRRGRLETVAAGCRAAGAVGTRVIVADLSSGAASLLAGLHDDPVHLCINAASATSRLRDSEIDVRRMREFAETDFLAPFDLLLALRERQPRRPPRVVFISSVLAGLPSPNREVYGTLKRLQEASLRRAALLWPELDVRVIRVGKVLATGPASAETLRLARFARHVLSGRRSYATWGFAGRVLTALFYVQPLAFLAATALHRVFWSHSPPRQPAP